jgi:hypothetical protein
MDAMEERTLLTLPGLERSLEKFAISARIYGVTSHKAEILIFGFIFREL